MKFSVCIPNYNYEKYLGRTLDSALAQQGVDLEVVLSDNASTDGSVEIMRSRAEVDPRVRWAVNPCNVGFAGNLDRAARLAAGDVMLMLSSDDLMRPKALSTYAALLSVLGDDAPRALISASADVIDANDAVTGKIAPDPELWRAEDRVDLLPGTTVYRVEGSELLRRCLATMKNPFNFLATAYPRSVYERVAGYGGGRLINPDKWFSWKILGAGTVAFWIDAPLFAYRVHTSNQGAQQAAAGALKYLVDEYASVIEMDNAQLEKLGMSRAQLEQSFVERDIARHGLAELARGRTVKARRILGFGASVYPQHALKNKKLWALAGLCALGPIGQKIAAHLYDRRTTTP
ncbi:glycosyltransferase [Myxococcota bacterium]|nr:glycosyltransferase [Myxococcota bacterium]